MVSKLVAFACSGVAVAGPRRHSFRRYCSSWRSEPRLRYRERFRSARVVSPLYASREGERAEDQRFDANSNVGDANGSKRAGELRETAREATATAGSATENADEDEELFPWITSHVEQVADTSSTETRSERWDARILREVAFMRRQKLRETHGMPAWLRFLIDIYEEWQMIEWPSTKRALRILVVSILFLVLSMAYIYTLDSVFGWLSGIVFEK
ncbi:hypothetical protein CCYA_CCYA07G2002 [Cyanidiococcus yangmingshanensis]|nr:hypothetical protein CCYA_CCYA07G2002 [Cyanidiococcus yangmingshanensis]